MSRHITVIHSIALMGILGSKLDECNVTTSSVENVFVVRPNDHGMQDILGKKIRKGKGEKKRNKINRWT